MLDPDDTSACVIEACCELCAATEYLEVRTLSTPVGLICLTLCPECELEPIPPLALGDAFGRVLEHCEHLDADLDAIAAAVAAKDADR